MNSGDLTNEQWDRLAPHRPPQRPATGRPARDHRTVLNGILWVLRTGAPWRDLPERYGPWPTCSSRFRRWQQAGIWPAIRAALQRDADADAALDWAGHYVAATVVRAHQHAAGAKGDPAADALGRSHGGFSTKVHLRAEGGGKPMTVVLTPGQQHEATGVDHLLAGEAVKRVGRGRPRHRPGRVVGAKGYSSRKIRQGLRRRGIRVTSARRRTEARGGPFDRAIYRQRNRVERLINRLKQDRRIATRYEKRAVSYQAMLTLAAIMLWL